MQGQADGRPRGPTRNRLAEQLDVVVPASEDALVERLLHGPDRGGDRACNGAVQRSASRHEDASVTVFANWRTKGRDLSLQGAAGTADPLPRANAQARR